MHAAPPELHLLLMLLRHGLGSARAEEAAPKDTDWPRFMGLVERHRVAGFLHQRAQPALAALLPAPARQRLAALATAVAPRALQRAAVQLRLVRSLQAAGITAISVKGIAAAQRLHGSLATRHVGDIDLLIPPGEARRADAALREAGLRRSSPDFELTPRQMEEFIRMKPDFEYTLAEPPLRIELLWRLEGIADTAAIWDKPTTQTLAGHLLRVLPPAIDASYLLQHGARHGWFRLFWLVDAALLFRETDLDWAAIAATARREGTERALLQAAALAEQLLGVAPPAALRPGADEKRRIDDLVREAQRSIVQPVHEHEPLGEWLRQLRYRVALQRPLRAKYATLAPHLFSPLSWRALPLPDRWFFLYTILNPVLWAWRRLRPRRSAAPPAPTP